ALSCSCGILLGTGYGGGGSTHAPNGAPQRVQHPHKGNEASLRDRGGLGADGAERAAREACLEPGRDAPHGADVAGQPVDLALDHGRGPPTGLRARSGALEPTRDVARPGSVVVEVEQLGDDELGLPYGQAAADDQPGEVVLVATWQLAHRH